MKKLSSRVIPVHRHGDNLGTTGPSPEDKLCTSCACGNSSRKLAESLVAQGDTRLELDLRRARRAGQPGAIPGGGRTGRPGRAAGPQVEGGESGTTHHRIRGRLRAAGQAGDRRLRRRRDARADDVDHDRRDDRSRAPDEGDLGRTRRGSELAPHRAARPSAAVRETGQRGRPDETDDGASMRSTDTAGRPATATARATGGDAGFRRTHGVTTSALGGPGPPGRQDGWSCSRAPRSHTSRGPASVSRMPCTTPAIPHRHGEACLTPAGSGCALPASS